VEGLRLAADPDAHERPRTPVASPNPPAQDRHQVVSEAA
jgi:hypothetical protein